MVIDENHEKLSDRQGNSLACIGQLSQWHHVSKTNLKQWPKGLNIFLLSSLIPGSGFLKKVSNSLVCPIIALVATSLGYFTNNKFILQKKRKKNQKMEVVCKYFQCGFCKFGESCR